MENFSQQCLDMAQSFLGMNLEFINEDGTITPVEGEGVRPDESAHAALAIGEYYRATGEVELGGYDLVDLAARCITAQAFSEEDNESGMGYTALALLSFGPSKERNLVWERLVDETREMLDKRLLMRSDYDNHLQAFNIAKAVTRYSMGLSKKDETGKLVDKFLERIDSKSASGFMDDAPQGLGGCYDIYGVLSFIFIRQALQLHGNMGVKERKLPSMRTYAERYMKLISQMVRQDGLGWSYGKGIGAYGQMHCISLILQAMRDEWVSDAQKPMYMDVLRKLFMFFFATYLDQEHGMILIRDGERNTMDAHTTRMANFDAARYMCQWSRLAKTIGGVMQGESKPTKTMGRFVQFDRSSKKEQGLFIYENAASGLMVQLPLVSGNGHEGSDYLAFPHAPGVFDWPVATYLPVMVPELSIEGEKVVPCFYGVRCTTGLGLKNAFQFKYEQPEVITHDQKRINGLGSWKVMWSFAGDKIGCEFVFTPKRALTMDAMRYVIALGAPHSQLRVGTSFTLGEESVRAHVVKDDFQAAWSEIDVVSEDPKYATYYGNINYLQTLKRDRALQMRAGQQYKLALEFEPDLAFADE